MKAGLPSGWRKDLSPLRNKFDAERERSHAGNVEASYHICVSCERLCVSPSVTMCQDLWVRIALFRYSDSVQALCTSTLCSSNISKANKETKGNETPYDASRRSDSSSKTGP
jgi:hypothetical protein